MSKNFKRYLKDCFRVDLESVLNERSKTPPGFITVGNQSIKLPTGPDLHFDPDSTVNDGEDECPICDDLENDYPGYQVFPAPGFPNGWYAIYDADGNLVEYIDVGPDGIYGTDDDNRWPPGTHVDMNGNIHVGAIPPGCQGAACAWPAGTWTPEGYFYPSADWLLDNGLPLNLVRGPAGHYWTWEVDEGCPDGCYRPWQPTNPGGDASGPSGGQSIADWWNGLDWATQALIIAAIIAGTIWLGSEIVDWIQGDDNNQGPPPPGPGNPGNPDPPDDPPPDPPDNPGNPDDPPDPPDPPDTPGNPDDPPPPPPPAGAWLWDDEESPKWA